MTIRTCSLFLVFSGLLAATAAAAPPPSGIMATINGVAAATNADSATRVNAYFAPTSWVVDEVAPYAWSGPSAGAAWWRSLDAANAQMHMSQTHASVGHIAVWHVTGDHAYVVVPLSLTAMMNGKPSHETGLWTLVLARHGSRWLIESAAWATETSS